MDAIITVDEAQRVLVFNAAAEAVFRCAAAEAIGESLERFIPARYREAHRRRLRGFAEAGGTERAMGRLGRVAALRADGEEFVCEASISRVAVGGRWLLTVIVRDATERDRAEAARRALEAKTQEAQKLEALGTLAGGIAHDFNNLIAVVLANVDLALLDGGIAPGTRDCLESIALAGGRARDLVRRILAFGRRQPQQRAAIDLRPALQEALRFLRTTLPAGIQLSARFDPATPLVTADPTEINQIAVNLCTNAWQAIEDREGGQIELRLDAMVVGEADVAAAPGVRPGRYARLSVADNGRGMDAATLARVFDPFFTTKEVGRGTGLGLSVVHAIARDLGGTVTAASAPGEGATFRVLLPECGPDDRGEEVAPSAPAERMGAGERVLVVDDEAQLVRAATLILERSGFVVAGHTRPEEALAAVQADPGAFDAVVADVNMPGMSGLAFTRELARVRPSLPVALTSGNLTPDVELEAEQVGVGVLLHKPYTTRELRGAVRALIEAAARRSAEPAAAAPGSDERGAR